mmetsp:Transcript_68575/g.143003  ORF Transcript_68575/g.143003 Transcript_68575/m.143003 type:complete len:142 (+) Transcript_68575:34-459(+)
MARTPTVAEYGSALLQHIFPFDENTPRLKAWGYKEIEKFSLENPEAGADVKTLRKAGAMVGGGFVAGLGGGVVFWSTRPGTLNSKLMSTLIGGLSCGFLGMLSSTSVASLTLGTYKIDARKRNDEFQQWWYKNGGAGGQLW